MRTDYEQEMYDRSELPGYFSKYVGVAKIIIPSEVTTKLGSIGDTYAPGSIWCECPEQGYEGANLLFCRYGLSIPFYQVKAGDRLWIEPTIGDTERWIYSGFVDCGRSSVDPTPTGTQAIFENEDGTFTISLGANMQLKLDSSGKSIDIIGSSDCKIEMDSDQNIIILTAGSNIIKLDGSANKIQLNGTNLEVAV